MRLVRAAGPILILAALTIGCGAKPRAAGHATERETPQPAPPTPDTTPIEALRTPAGLVLKIDPNVTPPPAPSPAPTPGP